MVPLSTFWLGSVAAADRRSTYRRTAIQAQPRTDGGTAPADEASGAQRRVEPTRERTRRPGMRRLILALAGAGLLMAGLVSPILACGGLIGPNGAVNLLRTTTLAGYHAGVEHYVTSFQFAGGEGEFGSIVPLPGI